MCNDMILPSLPESTLYGTIKLFGPADIFKFAVIMEQFVLKGIEFIFTKSMLFPLHYIVLLLAPPYSWLWLSCFYTLL